LNDPEIQALVDAKGVEIYPNARAEAWKVYQRAPAHLELDELHALALGGLAQAIARWQEYCAQNGHDPRALHYFGAYAMRRMRGAMGDAMRQQDWVTRSARAKAKAIREAGQDLGKTEEELARGSGLTIQEVRETLAAVSAKPVSMDAEPHDVPDSADVEGQAVVTSVLDQVQAVIARQPLAARSLLALHFYYGHPVPDAAAVIGVREDEAQQLFTDAVLAVHDAMIRAVT
jgi:RNA polymerase sigma factor for flagellar operon FliA